MKDAELEILPFDQFEQLPKEKMIEYLTDWIRKYKVKGVIQQWNLKYPPDYYIRLKKLGIYQEIVGKNRMRGRMQHTTQPAVKIETERPDVTVTSEHRVSRHSDSNRRRKRPAGIIRKIDELGRVVIPQETRSMLGISIFDALEVYTDDETEEIMVKKYAPGCIHCNSFDDLVLIQQKQICRNCLLQIVDEAKEKNPDLFSKEAAEKQHQAKQSTELSTEQFAEHVRR